MFKKKTKTNKNDSQVKPENIKINSNAKNLQKI